MRELPTLVCLHGGPGFDHSGMKVGLSRISLVGRFCCAGLEASAVEHRSTWGSARFRVIRPVRARRGALDGPADWNL